MAIDYLSLSDADFDNLYKFMCHYVNVKRTGEPPEWTHIPQEAFTVLANGCTAWNAAYVKTIGPHTPVETEAKNNAKKEAKKVIRPFVNQYLRFSPVTNEDRTAMKIPNRDTTPSDVPVPTAQPEADLTFPGIHLVELRKIRPVSGTAPDARSDYGVRIYYGLSGPANDKYKFRLAAEPKTGSDLPYSLFTRRKKELFDFDGESGNTVYFCLRYENSKGEAGPYGPMLKAVIP
jgi:hypothetical protein